MIEHCVALASFEHQSMLTASRGVLHQSHSHSLNGRERLLGGDLTTEEYIERDKETFTRFLRLVVSQCSARGQTINLNTNQELPRLIPVLCAYFSHEELVELVGEKLTNEILDTYHIEILQNMLLEHEFEQVLQRFNSASIPLMLIKGPALAYTVYPKAHLRTYQDIDALIHPDDLAGAHELLTQMGYVFYNEYRADAFDEQRTGYNYSLKRSDIPFPVLIELHTAPHSSEIGTLFDRDELWNNANTITIFGQSVRTMSPTDHLLYLCWHYRFHSFTRLLWLYDLVVMLRSVGPELDWMALIQAARRHQLAKALYYCLSWSRELFGVDIPREVFVRLRPPLISRLIVEHIAMPDIAEALVLSRMQTHRIIAHRTMVDSPAGIFKVGLQTLFPPPTALARRYIDHSRLPVQLYFLFYVVHPWLTLAKGCRYLLGNRRKGRRSKKQVSYHRAHQIREK